MPDTIDLEHIFKNLGKYGLSLLFKIGKVLRVKPALAYIEVHLVDHCNLNCKGCSHFSPIADKWFIDPNKYLRDIKQLKKLFSKIRLIRLMGGEPLLHPDLERILFQTRAVFPKADIRIATNGVLLDQMSDSFWKACKTNSIVIDLTLYPPVKYKLKILTRLTLAKKVRLTIRRPKYFYAFYNSQGKPDLTAENQKCVSLFHICPNLRNGRIYSCPIPAYVLFFNKRFGTAIPSDGYVDIFAPNLTGWDVKKALQKFPSACRYCTCRWHKIPKFIWAPSNKTMTEWDARHAIA